jgi:DNA repair exonuclease SbcCD ATPase subunit|tara:strand:+ start:3177 stop:4952 length:1776 start_codon:yes stop_codon:yes gene_type:complete
MLNIKTLSVKNFMSIGNVTQAVTFDDSMLTLVLGNNLDLGSNESRNGTGKTTIINALSYALFGVPLTSIKKDNLINKTNAKGMMCAVEFEKDGHLYKIERGRKPNIFKFIVDAHETDNGTTDEMQGEGRNTQAEINKVLGINGTLFKHLIALNTYTEPFLALRAHEQREMIELILGVTQLSEKADVLKETIKEVKSNIKEEEFKVKAQQEANAKIEKTIADLERRTTIWNKNQDKEISDLQLGIDRLSKIDIEKELKQHELLDEFNAWITAKTATKKELSLAEKALKHSDNVRTSILSDLEQLKNKSCPLCKQDLHSNGHGTLIKQKEKQLKDANEQVDKAQSDHESATAASVVLGNHMEKPHVSYGNIQHAYEHKSNLENLKEKLETKQKETDPYAEQIENLKDSAWTDVSFKKLNELTDDLTHREFLKDMLTKPDSYIRKLIVEQNLKYLNSKLQKYLLDLGLPHNVKFKNDLDVEITELGRDLDFDNLSRGERNRLILGLSWAFRDVFENLNHPINLLCIDELIDSGMDTMGVEASMAVLKKMSRERNKNVFLVSHKDELQSRVTDILQVTKENGFTTYEVTKDFVLE